jgi:hypothetical protein
MAELAEHVLVNRAAWTRANAEYTHTRARMAWAQATITWGVWSVPEAELHVLPDVVGNAPATAARHEPPRVDG